MPVDVFHLSKKALQKKRHAESVQVERTSKREVCDLVVCKKSKLNGKCCHKVAVRSKRQMEEEEHTNRQGLQDTIEQGGVRRKKRKNKHHTSDIEKKSKDETPHVNKLHKSKGRKEAGVAIPGPSQEIQPADGRIEGITDSNTNSPCIKKKKHLKRERNNNAQRVTGPCEMSAMIGELSLMENADECTPLISPDRISKEASRRPVVLPDINSRRNFKVLRPATAPVGCKSCTTIPHLCNEEICVKVRGDRGENCVVTRLLHEKYQIVDEAEKLKKSLTKKEKLLGKLELEHKSLHAAICESTSKNQQLQACITEKETCLKNMTEFTQRTQQHLDSVRDLLENELKCSICQELLVDARTLNCSHTFCTACIWRWMYDMKKRICPMCRTSIRTQVQARVVDSYIDKMVEKFSDDMKHKRQETVENRKNEATRLERFGREHRFRYPLPGTSTPDSEGTYTDIELPEEFDSRDDLRHPRPPARQTDWVEYANRYRLIGREEPAHGSYIARNHHLHHSHRSGIHSWSTSGVWHTTNEQQNQHLYFDERGSPMSGEGLFPETWDSDTELGGVDHLLTSGDLQRRRRRRNGPSFNDDDSTDDDAFELTSNNGDSDNSTVNVNADNVRRNITVELREDSDQDEGDLVVTIGDNDDDSASSDSSSSSSPSSDNDSSSNSNTSIASGALYGSFDQSPHIFMPPSEGP